jgi:hypothetical protein
MVALTGQPYAYTGDNPVNGVDPLGLMATNQFGQGCGAVIQDCSETLQQENSATCGEGSTTGIETSTSGLGVLGHGLDLGGGGLAGWNTYSNTLGEGASHASPESLEALARSGSDASDIARGLAPVGIGLTAVSDLLQGHSVAYSAGDAGATYGGAEGGALAGAALCSETGPGAIVCAGIGAFVGGGGAHWVFEHIFG